MNIIKPKKLKIGDTIGILAVSGRIKEYQNIENAKKFFEQEGFKVIISETCTTYHRYMAGKNDEDCIKAFHDFFLNDEIDVILSARGGYGTLRLINKINWDLIKEHPKIFAGYSDITILLNLIYKKTGLITFHSPMANGDFGSEINDYTKLNFFKTLRGEASSIKSENGKVYYKGTAQGTLAGGNLASLCCIDFIPDEDVILFLEDLNEPIYKIDRMLSYLFNNSEVRKKVKGIALGEFLNIDNKEMFDEIISEFADELKIPVSDGFKITHEKIKETIPVGVRAEFSADEGIIKINDTYLY